MSVPAAPTEIRRIEAAATHPLRQRVLRPHQPPEALHYPGDLEPGAVHLGAFDATGALVGIASLSIEPQPGRATSRTFRLRGMAVEPSLQGGGLGSQLVGACVAEGRAAGMEAIWCNARTSAERFYRRLGFLRVGDRFEIEGIGPHYVMRRDLA